MKLQDLYKKKTLAEYIIYASVLIGGVLLDQLSKWLTVRNMEVYQHIPVIKFGELDVASFLHIRNYGAAFGMFSDKPWIFNLISSVAIIAMIAMLFLGYMETKLSGIALSMMVSGGIGNMIDRVKLGYVVDMIHLDIFNNSRLFASVNTVFNVADTFVCVGAALLVLALTFEIIEEYKKEKLKKETDTYHGDEDSE